MSKTDEKRAFNQEGNIVHKALKEKANIVGSINSVVTFFELKRGGLKENSVKSVADEFKSQMREENFDSDQVALCWRLLAQSFYGVDRNFQPDPVLSPTVLLLGSFEQKNKLRTMQRYYEIMAEHGEDGDLGKRAMQMLAAVSLTPEIKEDVEQIVGAIVSFEKHEIKLDQIVECEDGGIIEDDDEEDDNEENDGRRRKKRKASSLATKRIAKKISEQKRKGKELKKKIKEGKLGEDGDGEEADVNEKFDENEDAKLAEVVENEQTPEEKKYKKVLAVFMDCIRGMMKKICLDEVFTYTVSQFMIDARNVAKANAKASKSVPSSETAQMSDVMEEDAAADKEEAEVRAEVKTEEVAAVPADEKKEREAVAAVATN